MHKIIRKVAIAAACLVVLGASPVAAEGPAASEGNVLEISLADAMAKPEMQQQLRGFVKLFFGNSPHPEVAHVFNRYATKKGVRSSGNAIQESCEKALLAALLQFQTRAVRLGADAVIDIHSYYRHQEVSNDTSVQCHDNIRKVYVVLIGNFVKLAAH